jgi:hypothetical protein
MSKVAVRYERIEQAQDVAATDLELLKRFEPQVEDALPKMFDTMTAWWERDRSAQTDKYFELVKYPDTHRRCILASFGLKQLEQFTQAQFADRLLASSHSQHEDQLTSVQIREIIEDGNTVYLDLKHLSGTEPTLSGESRLNGYPLRALPQDHSILRTGPGEYRAVLRNSVHGKFFNKGDRCAFTFPSGQR